MRLPLPVGNRQHAQHLQSISQQLQKDPAYRSSHVQLRHHAKFTVTGHSIKLGPMQCSASMCGLRHASARKHRAHLHRVVDAMEL